MSLVLSVHDLFYHWEIFQENLLLIIFVEINHPPPRPTPPPPPPLLITLVGNSVQNTDFCKKIKK